jgi:hypothetical protein
LSSGGSSESGATMESHPGSQPQIAVNPDAPPCLGSRSRLTTLKLSMRFVGGDGLPKAAQYRECL